MMNQPIDPPAGASYDDFERDFAGLIDNTEILSAQEQLRVREQSNKHAYAGLIQLGWNIRLRKAQGNPQVEEIADYFNSKRNVMELHRENQALRRKLGPLADADLAEALAPIPIGGTSRQKRAAKAKADTPAAPDQDPGLPDIS